MAREGDVIEIPVIGHRSCVLQSSRETGGESLRLEWCAPPRGNASEHVHSRQEAHLEVVSGTLGFCVGGRERTLGVRQSAVGPAGVPHAWRNLGDGEVCFLVEFRPALNTEALLVGDGRIARNWANDKVGTPKYLLQLAVLLREVGNPHLYLARPPVALQRALLAAFIGMLAPIGGRAARERSALPAVRRFAMSLDTQTARRPQSARNGVPENHPNGPPAAGTGRSPKTEEDVRCPASRATRTSTARWP